MLVLAAIVLLPLIFDSKPPAMSNDMTIEIPEYSNQKDKESSMFEFFSEYANFDLTRDFPMAPFLSKSALC